MIVVGLRNTDRIKNFTPTEVPDEPTSGGADSTVKFFKNELIPGIDKLFRTAPYRLLAGHSLAGLFSIYTLLNEADLFNAYITISPNLPFDDNFIFIGMAEKLSTLPDKKRTFYLAIGEKETELLPSCRQYVKKIRKAKAKNFRWKYDIIDDADHGLVVHEGIYKGLQFIYANWKYPHSIISDGVSGIQFHYGDLSRKLGYTIKPVESEVNLIGYALLNEGQLMKAIAVFKLNANLYPNSANVYDSLGDAYSALSDSGLAIENYRIAVDKGSENSDPNQYIYIRHLENIQKQNN